MKKNDTDFHGMSNLLKLNSLCAAVVITLRCNYKTLEWQDLNETSRRLKFTSGSLGHPHDVVVTLRNTEYEGIIKQRRHFKITGTMGREPIVVRVELPILN